MYDLGYVEPKLGGYIYRTGRRCGHPTCKCASSKYRHSFYRLEYRIKENGRWKKKREYIAKNKVKPLRQRIRRAKEKDRQRRQRIELFMQKTAEFINSDGWAEATQLKQLLDALSQQKLEPATLRQRTQLLKSIVKLLAKFPPDSQRV